MSDMDRMRKHMRRREIPGGVRFVTFSCHNRLPLLRAPGIARVFLDALASTKTRLPFELYAYVVMPEHVHLLMRPAVGVPLNRILLTTKHIVARKVVARWRQLHAPVLDMIATPTGPRFWLKGGGFDRNVRSHSEFTCEVRYIHENPVSRGIAARATDYAFSSVHDWLVQWRNGGRSMLVCDRPPGRYDWDSWRGFMDGPAATSHESEHREPPPAALGGTSQQSSDSSS